MVGNSKRGSSPGVKKQKIQFFSNSTPRFRKPATARVDSFDTELLDCPICYEPFTLPIYQCENGHTACSSCCQRIAKKCPSCALPIGSIRNRAIENVLESVKLSCKNSKYGCLKRLCYGEKSDHENICSSSPCPCPLPSCSSLSSSSCFYYHFQYSHKGRMISFIYDQTFTVSLTSNDTFLVLGVEGGSVFLLKNTSFEKIGNLITVNCIAPSSLNKKYCYDLATKIEGTSHTFRSLTKSISSNYEKQDAPFVGLLIDPVSAVCDNGKISLDVCIWNHTSKPAAIPSITDSV